MDFDIASWYKSLAFDPIDGYPSIAYSGFDELKFAHWNGTAWEIEVVEAGDNFGIFATLAYDPLTGLPAIAHRGGGLLRARFARFDGSQWVVEQFDDAPFAGTGASLVFDALGTPYIGSQSDDEVKVSTWDGIEWLTEVKGRPIRRGRCDAVRHLPRPDRTLVGTRHDATTGARTPTTRHQDRSPRIERPISRMRPTRPVRSVRQPDASRGFPV